MDRENRYLVVKYKDMECLTELEKHILMRIASKVDNKRVRDKRTSLTCVIVEHDWPEYETVWGMIADRVDKAKGK